MGHRGGKKKTAVPNQTVKITTEIQTPDSVDDLSRPRDELSQISNAENVSSELVGPSRIITTTPAAFRFVVSQNNFI